MKIRMLVLGISALVLLGCNHTDIRNDRDSTFKPPDISLASNLPIFKTQRNEVVIANSYSDIDPTYVIGSILKFSDNGVISFDNFLKPGIKIDVTPKNEIVFKDFVENSLAASASWLSFISINIVDNVKAEVSIVKSARVTTPLDSIDRGRLIEYVANLPKDERNNYGVVIGYIDYLLSASMFKKVGIDGGATGYGAKIGGSWYSNIGNNSADHRIIAIVSHLPIVMEKYTSKVKSNGIEFEILTDIDDNSQYIKQYKGPIPLKRIK